MKSKVTLAAILIAAPIFVFANTEDFSRPLKVGMRGADVRALQVMLNSDIETRITATGAGSPGNETDYFGLATKGALVKFQEKYRGEVLTPAGLIAGTGFFGEKTRAKAKALLLGVSTAKSTTSAVVEKNVNTATTTLTPQKTEARVMPEGDMFIASPSRYSGVPGTEITISGEGFTPTNNAVYFDLIKAAENFSSPSGAALTLKVPNVPKGIYHLSVKNTRGQSKGDSFFVVTDGVTPEPKVEGVTPGTAARGSLVTVKGSGFTATGNMVRTTVDIVEGVSSTDGRSLSFVLSQNILTSTIPSTFPAPSNVLPNNFSPSVKKVFLPVWIFVVNENGVSNGKSFNLEL